MYVIKRRGKSLLMFYCPGCNLNHVIPYGTGEGNRWTWDNNTIKPNIIPSIVNKEIRKDLSEIERKEYELERANIGNGTLDGKFATRCHLNVTNGKIIYLGDCTHHLSGQTIDMISID